MWTAKEQLGFVVNFIRLDIETLRAGDLLNLKDDLSHFLGRNPETDETSKPTAVDVRGFICHPDKDPLSDDFTKNDLNELQKEMKEIVKRLVGNRGRSGMTSRLTDLNIQYTIFPLGKYNMMALSGPTRDIALMTLFLLLRDQKGNAILCCPECKTVFFRIKKQKYCSRSCTNKANVQAWRKTKAGKKYESDRSRRRYEEKIKKDLGDKVIINKGGRKAK